MGCLKVNKVKTILRVSNYEYERNQTTYDGHIGKFHLNTFHLYVGAGFCSVLLLDWNVLHVFLAIFWCMEHEDDDVVELTGVEADKSFASLTADLLKELEKDDTG